MVLKECSGEVSEVWLQYLSVLLELVKNLGLKSGKGRRQEVAVIGCDGGAALSDFPLSFSLLS